MIKSKHYKSPLGNPVFYVDSKYEMLWEIWSCPRDYIRDVVRQLELVKKWEIEKYDFANGNWTTIVECYSDNQNAVIWYKWDDWEDLELWVPFEEIYNLMKEWDEYIDVWEKKTGKIKG